MSPCFRSGLVALLLALVQPAAAGPTMMVACGQADQVNCALVVPEIDAAAPYVQMRRMVTQGSLASAQALCQGKAGAAVVELNVLASLGASCPAQLSVVGPPLYPRKGYLFVRASEPANDFADMVRNAKSGALRVGADDNLSNSNLTFRAVLDGHPEWKLSVEVLTDGSMAALEHLRDRELDAVFVLDGPHSPLIEEMRQTVDPLTGAPLFKLISIRPGPALLSKTYLGRTVFAPAIVQEGWFSNTVSVMTPAVFAINASLYARQPALPVQLAATLQQMAGFIAARAGAKGSWLSQFNGP